MDGKPEIGMVVCDCKYQHLKIVKIILDEDLVKLEDGSICSFKHCCDSVPHDWEHPDPSMFDYHVTNIDGPDADKLDELLKD